LHFANQNIVLPPQPAGAIYVRESFNHMGGNISVEGSSAGLSGGAVLRRAPVELLGTSPHVCDDCSPLDTLFGVWNDTCGVSEICVSPIFGVFDIQSRGHRHS